MTDTPDNAVTRAVAFCPSDGDPCRRKCAKVCALSGDEVGYIPQRARTVPEAAAPTPETDAFIADQEDRHASIWEALVNIQDHARSMERQLTQARAVAKKAEALLSETVKWMDKSWPKHDQGLPERIREFLNEKTETT